MIRLRQKAAENSKRFAAAKEADAVLKDYELENLREIARGVAAQFGPGCEVVIHEVSQQAAEHSIVAIENGQVSGRRVGDGPSQTVLEHLNRSVNAEAPSDRFAYLTRTPSGKLLKSSTMPLRDENGTVCALFCINFDVSALALAGSVLASLTSVEEKAMAEPAQIPGSISDLLDALIDRSVRLVGKPVELMTKEDKITAIRFLSDNGALLVTKSGDKIAKFFGISKYTLYSYLDTKQEDKNND